MKEFLQGLLASIMPTVVQQIQQTSGTDLVANLLTGGGFMFLAAVMGGLALWNKNQSESIASINKASQEFVEGARTEVASARADALAAREDASLARKQAVEARRQLEEAQEANLYERQKARRRLQVQNEANAEHNLWDDELKAEVQRLGGVIRDAPPLPTFHDDDPTR